MVVTIALATEKSARPEANIDKATEDFLVQHCADCHSGDKGEGGLKLDMLAGDFSQVDTFARWEKVLDRVAQKEMPPEGNSLLDSDRARFVDHLEETLHSADLADVQAHGRGPLRRLNRREYEQNLRDLLHLPDLDIRDMLPEDRESQRTNKSAEALDITRVQLAAYLDAAAAALKQAVASGVRPRPSKRYFALATNMFPKAIDHAGRESTYYARNSRMVPLSTGELAKIRKEGRHDPEMEVAIFRSASWPYYGYPEGFVAEESGRYHVRFQARSVRQVRDFRLLPGLGPQPMTFRARQPSKADVSGDVRAVGGLIDIQPQEAYYETSVLLSKGETIEYSLLGLPVPFPNTSHGGPLYYDFPPMPEDGHPGIAFRSIEIIGPQDAQDWPPPAHRALFGDLPIIEQSNPESDLAVEVVSSQPVHDSERLLKAFAIRAARQNVSDSILQPYLRLIRTQLADGMPFGDAMLIGYRAFLCSEHFLFLKEPLSADADFAIASRLSHFLWNTRPDAVILSLAEQGTLCSPSVLRLQADRMIDDAKFESFVDNFTDYWLDLRHIKRDLPDIRLYPEYRFDDYLVESMERETRSFFRQLIRRNLPAESLVTTDFVLVNDRLSQHYELPRVFGSHLREVPVPAGSPLGGLLTQAAIMKVTSNGTSTSPVVRGAWIMDRIAGQRPPPPPDKVPAIEPDLRGATTIRDQLAKHARDPLCSSCHKRFDPVGFALENFDIFGGWRDRYRSLDKGDEITGIDRAGHAFSYRIAGEIDAAGKLLDGREFRNIVELKQLLRVNARQLARNLLQRFTVYATGTPVRFSDRREIESILDRCEANKFLVGDMLREFIASPIFVGYANAKQTDDNTVSN